LLRIRCGCGREVWKAPTEFTTPGSERPKVRGHVEINDLAERLLCRCGRKGAAIAVVIDPLVPPGVPALDFLRADDRERKRMIRMARG